MIPTYTESTEIYFLETRKGFRSSTNVVLVLVVLVVIIIIRFFENSLKLCQYATDRN